MFERQLQELGLSDKEAVAYEALARAGLSQPADLVKPTKLGRTTIYALLEGLVKKGLVEKKPVKNKLHFVVTHPHHLGRLVQDKEKAVEQARNVLDVISPELGSLYTLVSHKPVVRFFEGSEGIWELLLDSLAATSEVLQYVDGDAIQRIIPDLNKKYIRIREQKKLKKRIILLDPPELVNLSDTVYATLTNTRYIARESRDYNTSLMIYDNKISYFVFSSRDTMIGTLIEDPNIAAMHRSLFEHSWSTAELMKKK